MLGLSGSRHLCLDHTNRKIGRKEINLLVLAVATRRYRVPLIRTVLGKADNSNTKERIGLVPLRFRSLTSFRRPFVRMARGFCRLAMSGGGAGYKTR